MNDLSRDNQMREWVLAAPENDTQSWSGDLYWGVWLSPDNEDCPPPDALFGSEEAADAFAKSTGRPEYNVGPVVVDLTTRNDFMVPERLKRVVPREPHRCEEECCVPK